MVRAFPSFFSLALLITSVFLHPTKVTAQSVLLNNEWQKGELEHGTRPYSFHLRSPGGLAIIVEPCEGCVEVTVNHGSDQLGKQFNSAQGTVTALERAGMQRSLNKGFYEYLTENASAGEYTIFVERYSGCYSKLSYRIMVSTDIRAYGRPILPADATLRVLNTSDSSITVGWKPLLSPANNHYCVYRLNIGGVVGISESSNAVLHVDPTIAIGSACGITDDGENHITETLVGCSIEDWLTVSYDLESGANYIIEVLAYGATDDKTTSYTALQTRTGGIYSDGLTVVPSCFIFSITLVVVMFLIN
ncbi:uncharacterized protein LOC134185424 [Corticium candelabrum]|uniref:uncharacterized protein LOC134185424 n=1 Tax=Corticium candelabrum TaxID=121492 RepID=UPI002E2602CD|nr:uncharacterized protein LOC134185424 [Corticium candelabrum]